MKASKLIVLRGPSGSGKSTVAKMLFESATRKIALIDQDHYRFIFKPAGGGSKPNSDSIHKMIKSDTLIALKDGYDVILEGILSVKSYSKVLDEIFVKHPEGNFMFYFDISLEETLKRHKSRAEKFPDFGEKEMREWYPVAHRSNHRLEQIIPEAFSAEKAFKFIKRTSKL
ncbi:MAG TPA: AAA family ATPase [Candidatus Dormibacteraeota bacterium]|nr:AAA family ATPase [Candidatus Dormibacteraeota bacterium]